MKTLQKFRLAGTASLVAVMAATSVVPTAAFAQEIEEIIVTARKREENLQSVPVAVTAITAEQLRDENIKDAYDIADHTPGVEVKAGSGSRTNAVFYIRGQGQAYSSGPAVAVYFNEAATGNSDIQFFDLASVQVLKGPQGTLFGRSTTGGAVLYSPRKPGDEFDGFVEARTGSRNDFGLTGAVNVPLVEGVLNLRAAGSAVSQRGYTYYPQTGQHKDGKNRKYYRIGLDFKPTDFIDSYTLFAGAHVHEPQGGVVLVSYNANLATLNTGPTGAGRAAVTGICNATIPATNPTGRAACIADRVGRLDAVRTAMLSEFTRTQAGGDALRQGAAQGIDFVHSHTQQLMNTTTVELGEIGPVGDITLKNILSGTRTLFSQTRSDFCGSGTFHCIIYGGIDIIGGQPVYKDYVSRNSFDDNYSEEFQILGEIEGGHNWILGYYTERTLDDETYPSNFQVFNYAVSNPLGTVSFQGNRSIDVKNGQDGFFAQGTFDFGAVGVDGLHLTGGFRRTKSLNQLKVVQNVFTAAGLQSGPVLSNENFVERASTWSVTLDYQFNPDMLGYIAHRRGFKPGGFNRGVIGIVGVPGLRPQFGPETVDDIEAGAKVDWSFGGISGRSNLAVYKSWYNGVQRAEIITNPNPPFVTINQVNNIAGVDIWGMEFENRIVVTDSINVVLNYGLIDAKYSNYPGTVRAPDGTIFNNIDAPYPGNPKHSGLIGVRYTLPLDESMGQVVGGLDYQIQSSVHLDDNEIIDPFKAGFQKGYSTLNGRIDWKNVAGHPVDVGFFVRNIADSIYKVGTLSIFASVGMNSNFYNPPRTWGLEVRYRFGASAE